MINKLSIARRKHINKQLKEIIKKEHVNNMLLSYSKDTDTFNNAKCNSYVSDFNFNMSECDIKNRDASIEIDSYLCKSNHVERIYLFYC